MAIPEDILITAQVVPPVQAIEQFEKKGLEVTETAAETRIAVEKRLFAVTKSINMDVLQDFRNELKKSLREGQPFESFKKNITNTLAQKGWTGKRQVKLKNGKIKTIQTTPWRLKTIYNTNMQSALNAGRFDRQIENVSDRPYFMLIEILDESTRKTHRSRSGSIQIFSSKFWRSPNSWYPPNGFGCRGRVRSLTFEQAKKRGIGTKGKGRPDKGFGRTPNTFFTPDRANYDTDIWNAGQKLKPDNLK